MRTMKLTGIREMEMFDVPDPLLINESDVLIKIKSLGICGSDIHYYTSGRIGSQVVSYPFTVGHECSGIVERVGKSASKIKPGDRVAIDPAMPCGECDQCLSGRPHTCRKLKFLGCPGQAEGALTDYLIMPESSCYTVPADLDYEKAALIEPLSIGVYAVRQSIPMKGAKVGILGFGPIGMSVMLAAMAEGAAKVFVTDKIDARLAIARKCGAYSVTNVNHENEIQQITRDEPLLLDVIFECCGQQEAFDNAFHLLKPGGKLMLVGIPEFDRWSFSVDLGRRKEINIQHVRRQNDCVEDAIEMVSSGKINISDMPTHRFKLDDSKKAFDMVAGYRDGVMKAMIEFE